MTNSFRKRTHTCGELNTVDINRTVVLNGWVDRRRDLGGVIFIDLRDRYGITQVVFAPQHNKKLYDTAQTLRTEYVISVEGKVSKRPPEAVNKELETGMIEVIGESLEILNKSDLTPFQIENNIEVTEDLRLQYRYLDLRRKRMNTNLMVRHKTAQAARKFFDENDFIEIETPFLMKSTPEGARDFLVPSRIHKGKFYALPQSPQTYKQILMVSGFDRYFQIVKCFRDEDLRADRQPEFTQIDVEMSFVTEDDVMNVSERLMRHLCKDILKIDIKIPFDKLTYKETMEKYGTDKPDRRFNVLISDISSVVQDSEFKVFKETVSSGGVVAGFAAPGCAAYSRSQLDALVETAKSFGGKGLVYIKVNEDGFDSPVKKFIREDEFRAIAEKTGAGPGDLILIVADSRGKTFPVLGDLRLELGNRLNLIDKEKTDFVWVTDFPLFEWNEEDKRYYSVHHPFTAPKPEDIKLLQTTVEGVRARAYDLVMNGNEIAGGSIRIHEIELQRLAFQRLGISDEEAEQKFGFLLNAFKYGAPPHGGIAFGFDRMVMLFTGQKSIREVIAFPKTSSGLSLMDRSPSEVDHNQLEELHIQITDKNKE